ncbi:MAG: protein-methionine-sulfoxide reductase catalytic subunit MsrP [Rubellimicrobium sp.]|nr:protein-methionine-sulfoxide reductase catalytic subunit MsrP [Rubellimicrobium sp.]
MAGRWTNRLTRGDATPHHLLLMGRRRAMALLGAGAAATGLPAMAADDAPNTPDDIRGYNNFYEFGYDKTDPARYAGAMVTSSWTVRVDGLVDNPGDWSLGDLLAGLEVEERIYRLRCVEAWSMVIPWNGVELAQVLGRLGPQADARYVAFETVVQPAAMPGVRAGVLDFPYVEGLRLDEAMHPLTLLATGLWGEPLANQNGAPVRLVVPWKYGFKSIKSITRITLTADRPPTTWNLTNPREYGFMANVNPGVDHPRWSQSSERMIGAGLFGGRRDTEMFNGYADEVAHLYAGMDLAQDF